MPDGIDTTPTRAAVLELKEEHQVVREGYDFLDEKRLLLAAETLRQLEHYESLMEQFEKMNRHAVSAFADAVDQHGFNGLQVYPAQTLEHAWVQSTFRSFLGVRLMESSLEIPQREASRAPVNPSAAAARCGRSFGELMEHAAVVAGVVSNLLRLIAEYRRTERRARALEDVILPEVEETLRDMESHLEEVDQEEAIRTRLHYGERSQI
jgi:V/A-type H+-transporting ATPase subunit D